MPGFYERMPEPKDPHLRRWMAFIDGENFTLRAQDVAKRRNIELRESIYYKKDIFIWFPRVKGTKKPEDTGNLTMRLQDYAIRSYYYTSVLGDDNKVAEIKSVIWT